VEWLIVVHCLEILKRIGDKVQIHGVIDRTRGKASTYKTYGTDGQSLFS